MENKEAGYLLFENGWDQKRIAEALKVSEKTIGTWKKADNWERKRSEIAIAKETSEEKLWHLINYQLTALTRKTEKFEKEEVYTLLDKGDIDALTKMFSSVKNKQHTWAQVVEIITEFVEFCEEKNFSLTKKLLELSDEFLLTKKSSL